MKKLSYLILIYLTIFSCFFTNSFSYTQKMDSWAKASFENLDEKNIIPEILREKNLKDNITRLEFTHLIVTYLLSNKSYKINSKAKKYTDIDDSFVNLASSLNITTGYSDGTFKPYMYITRSEAAVIANNAEILLGFSKEGSVSTFKDHKLIPSWAVKSVGAIVSSGAMNGYPNKTFSPSKNITRQEAVVMVNKMLENKSGNLIDAFNISKNDEYMTKLQYDFVISNIPMSKYKIETVKQRIFQTSEDRKMSIYEAYNKTVPFSSNDIITSPNLIFDDNSYSYIMGIESKKTISGKKEQRVFMISTLYDGKVLRSESTREYSPWFTISN